MAEQGLRRLLAIEGHLRPEPQMFMIGHNGLRRNPLEPKWGHFETGTNLLRAALSAQTMCAHGDVECQNCNCSQSGARVACHPVLNCPLYQLSDCVRSALDDGRPVVALESTIVCHGMPYPQNLKTAREVEQQVRANGAEPATIAIIAGVVHIGLSDAELEALARRGLRVKKTARRDIAHVVSQKLDGATTVSATMFFAAKVGISVFVTGGIGGVHRGAESSMDISSDLTELGRTPVAVVCAGVKSILDIPRTLEYLETQGVTVAALGSDEFPAFFTPNSGCKAPCRADSEEQCAQLIDANLALGLGSGIVIGVPIPASAAAMSLEVEKAIQQALGEARGVVGGADSTPFLLKRVNELTGGASLVANIALVKNNAMVGAKVARRLAMIRRTRQLR